jgi:hypothetical protein
VAATADGNSLVSTLLGHASAAMTARYTGEIPLEQIRAEFSSRFGDKLEVLEEEMENEAAA